MSITGSDHADRVGYETLKIISGADKFNRWMYQEIKPFLNGQVLELGSGIGNISAYVLADGYQVTLSDYNNAYFNQLTERFRDFPNLQGVFVIDLQDPDFETKHAGLHQQFDSIFLLNVIEHIADDILAVKNCSYLLKPGGRLILLAPAYSFLYCGLDKNLGHYRRYTVNSLSCLLEENKLTTTKKKYFNLAGLAGWLWYGKILQKPVLQQKAVQFYNNIIFLSRAADRLAMNAFGLSAITVGKK